MIIIFGNNLVMFLCLQVVLWPFETSIPPVYQAQALLFIIANTKIVFAYAY